jgi:hypothetical protein
MDFLTPSEPHLAYLQLVAVESADFSPQRPLPRNDSANFACRGNGVVPS